MGSAIEYQKKEETKRRFGENYSTLFFNKEMIELVRNRIKFSLNFIKIQKNENFNAKLNLIYEQLCQLIEILFYLLNLVDRSEEENDQQIELLNEIFSFQNLKSKAKEIALKFHQFHFLIENFIGDNEEEIEKYYQNYFIHQNNEIKSQFRFALFNYLENNKKFRKLFQPNDKFDYTKGSYKEDLKSYLKSHLPDNAWLSSIYFSDFDDLTSIANEVDDDNLEQKKIFFSLSKIGAIISGNEDQKLKSEFQLYAMKFYEELSISFHSANNPIDHFDYFLSLTKSKKDIANDLLDKAYFILLRLLEVFYLLFKKKFIIYLRSLDEVDP